MAEPIHRGTSRTAVYAWSLYDFANTIFSMNVISLYTKRYLVEDLKLGDFWFDLPFSLAMLLVVIGSPLLGAVSDQRDEKMRYVIFFTLVCCVTTAAMGFVGASPLLLAMLFIAAVFAYESAQPFYNALLYSVAEGREARYVSGLGVALGYVGAIAGMILVMPFVTGNVFGLVIPFIPAGGKVGAFVPTGALFLFFSLPLFLFVRERHRKTAAPVQLGQAIRDLKQGLSDSKKYPGVRRFLLATFFTNDAANTVIVNIGIYCSLVFGFVDTQINIFLIVATLTAAVGSHLFGLIARRQSLKFLQLVIGAGWIIGLAGLVIVSNGWVVWLFASIVGVMLGALWTTSRPYLAELVPPEEHGRFFGLFALAGRASAVVGPLLWTSIILLFRPDSALGRWSTSAFSLTPAAAARLPYQAGLASLALMMLIGFILMQTLPESEPQRFVEASPERGAAS